jgi:ribosome-associated protein
MGQEPSAHNVLQINAELSIPLSELHFRFSASGGPGGQNVNRTATRVELLFDVRRSPSLGEVQRTMLLHRLRPALDQEGVLRLVSQATRSQLRNREDALLRFRLLLAQSLRRPRKRIPTQPSRASRERRLQSKGTRSLTKQQRRRVFRDEW